MQLLGEGDAVAVGVPEGVGVDEGEAPREMVEDGVAVVVLALVRERLGLEVGDCVEIGLEVDDCVGIGEPVWAIV